MRNSKNKSSSTGVLGKGKCLGAAGCSKAGRVGTAAPKGAYLWPQGSFAKLEITGGVIGLARTVRAILLVPPGILKQIQS